MNQSNKILTVAYGTFSCTLEGFEDSFETMKAIAEYFRDLAADDRYFGAEPPTPDAEMLARIAENEIARRVEARLGADGIHLRAAAPAVAAPLAAAHADDESAELPQADAPRRDIAEPAQDDAPDAPDLDAAQGLDAFDDEVTSDETLDFAADEDNLTPQDVPEVDLGAISAAVNPASAEVDVDADDTAADLESELEEDLDEAFAADDLDEVLPAEEPAPRMEAEEPVQEAAPAMPEPEAAAHPDPSSVAAKLARIRQVVSTKPAADEDGFVDDGFTEDQHAEAAPAAAPAAPEDTIANVLDQLGESVAADDAELHAAEAEPAQGAPAAFYDDADDDADDLTADDLATSADQDDDDEGQPEPRDVQPRKVTARVMKVKREAIENAVASGMIEEITDEDDTPEAPAPARRADSSLSDDDEAELQAALAEVAAEMGDTPPPAPPAPADQSLAHEADADPYDADEDDLDADDDPDMEASEQAGSNVITPRPGRNVLLERGVGDDGSDISRLLDKADSEMAEPQGRQRRNAISHLRAAMAATRDDDALKSGNDTEQGSEAYRNDLDEVVRPRRPMTSGAARDARPDEGRTAPLQLVAEQRIDADEDATAKPPVRPRRVSALSAIAEDEDDGVEFDGDVSFAEFAEEMGATELPDLLEAAASYMSFVEKRPAFSRPQLMTKVRQAEVADYTREDRLRSFGVLLREGKIQKTQGGQFTASDRISFRPDEGRAAG